MSILVNSGAVRQSFCSINTAHLCRKCSSSLQKNSVQFVFKTIIYHGVEIIHIRSTLVESYVLNLNYISIINCFRRFRINCKVSALAILPITWSHSSLTSLLKNLGDKSNCLLKIFVQLNNLLQWMKACPIVYLMLVCQHQLWSTITPAKDVCVTFAGTHCRNEIRHIVIFDAV